jgi:predicted nucleic acid-binding protein
MEQLLQYVWKHRLLPLGQLLTTDGRVVEVIDPGLHNRSNQGPDFFNSKVRIGGTLWVGNVEVHLRSADWYAHHHDRDAAYNNVVLHVVEEADADVLTEDGHYLPQLVLRVPAEVSDNYQALLSTDHYPPCYQIIPSLSPLMVHAWMAALQTERLEQKTEAIAERARRLDGSWEDAYFVTLARNYGFGINGDAFEQWALNVPLHAVGKHRDDLFQVEAIFMGQAGLLQPEAVPRRHREAALSEGYFARLRSEYEYLAHKFSLQPMDHSLWRFLRLRPQNFPHIRISQLAQLYYERKAGLSVLLECETLDQLRSLLQTHVTPYWQTHYAFGAESARSPKRISDASTDLLIINTAVPMLFAVGRHRQKEAWCDRAFDLLEQLRAERNHIVSMWAQCGLQARSAGDSQALIQLKKEYCDRKDCLRCRFGFEYLKGKR